MSAGRLAMPTRILIVGGGGREHALAWKLSVEPGINEVVVTPGSDAIGEEPRVRVVAPPAPDPAAVVALARSFAAELVVVGPEAPLAAGLVDALQAAGITALGPTAAAARIETSKAFCHDVARAAGVPMAAVAVCASRDAARAAIERLGAAGDGFVVKEDGLAAGKGVTVFGPGAEPVEAAAGLIDELYRDAADRAVLVEERLRGPEASVIALCDGVRAIAFPAARDHKRLLDGDRGPNTGGMGAYSPLPELDDVGLEAIVRDIHEPVLAELARRGTPFRGFLYAGLMLTDSGPRLLECNARLGDPEAQVLLPRIAGSLGPLLLAAARGALPPSIEPRLAVVPGATVGIVLASDGYPTAARLNEPIDGLDRAIDAGALVFHAGTSRSATGAYRTAGGRVVTVVGRGPDLAAARDVAERAIDLVAFDGMQRRHDIATDALVAGGAR